MARGARGQANVYPFVPNPAEHMHVIAHGYHLLHRHTEGRPSIAGYEPAWWNRQQSVVNREHGITQELGSGSVGRVSIDRSLGSRGLHFSPDQHHQPIGQSERLLSIVGYQDGCRRELGQPTRQVAEELRPGNPVYARQRFIQQRDRRTKRNYTLSSCPSSKRPGQGAPGPALVARTYAG